MDEQNKDLSNKSLVYFPCITTDPFSIMEDKGRGHQKLYYYSSIFDKVYVLSYGPKKIEKKNNIYILEEI